MHEGICKICHTCRVIYGETYRETYVGTWCFFYHYVYRETCLSSLFCLLEQQPVGCSLVSSPEVVSQFLPLQQGYYWSVKPLYCNQWQIQSCSLAVVLPIVGISTHDKLFELLGRQSMNQIPSQCIRTHIQLTT